MSAGADQGQPAAANTTPALFAWRHYALRTGTQPRRLGQYLEQAALPALNRLGVSPVGAFEVVAGPAAPGLFLLLPFADLSTFVGLDAALAGDEAYRRDGAAYLESTAADPVFVRYEQSLLQAFPNVPRIEVPAATAAQRPRLFELRIYESPSEHAHRAKVDMFVKMGEVDIFRRVGLKPVFFGRTIAGGRMPNLTYMLVHDDLAARDKSWNAFRTDPEWKKLAATPGYADAEILTNITTWLLRPAGYSQV